MAKRIKNTLTYKEYAAMDYEELFKTLNDMIKQAQRMVVWFGSHERIGLLPALQAMKDKVAQPGRRIVDPKEPNWEDVCRMLGITPDLVRTWRMRTAANTDIRHLVGEERPKPQLSPEQESKEAKRHLKRLCLEVVNGDMIAAYNLASRLVEEYGFDF
jgi:hypothetical protein